MSENGPPPVWVITEMATAKTTCSTTTTQGLKRTAAHTSTGSGAKPRVRCPGARVSSVAAARVAHCEASSTRRTPRDCPFAGDSQQPERCQQEHRRRVGGHDQAERRPERGVQQGDVDGRDQQTGHDRPHCRDPEEPPDVVDVAQSSRQEAQEEPADQGHLHRVGHTEQGGDADRPAHGDVGEGEGDGQGAERQRPARTGRREDREDTHTGGGEPGSRRPCLATDAEGGRTGEVHHEDETTHEHQPSRARRVPFHGAILAHTGRRRAHIRTCRYADNSAKHPHGMPRWPHDPGFGADRPVLPRRPPARVHRVRRRRPLGRADPRSADAATDAPASRAPPRGRRVRTS